MKPIIDVSEYQGDIDWSEASKHVAGAIIRLSSWRLSDGGNRLDHKAQVNAYEVLDAGLPIGAYVRANPWANSPATELMLFRAWWEDVVLDKVGDDDTSNLILTPAIDIEPTDKPEFDALVNWPEWIRSFIQLWNVATDSAPLMLYTSGSFFDSKYGGVLDIPLNVSFWVGDAAGFNHAPDAGGKTKWVFSGRTVLHQYSHKGTIPGIKGAVDLNAVMPYTQIYDLDYRGRRD